MDPRDPTTWPASARAFYERRHGRTPETPLLSLLRDRIRREGPLTFAQFMEAALYHPEHGYYLRSASPIGAQGDFMTAPVHHPAFGRLVGRRVRQILEGLGDPEAIVVEMGAGDGSLAHGVLTELAPDLRPRYRIIEPFPVWRARQERRLAEFGAQVEWTPGLDECEPFRGVFHSNELPDAFPVHRVVVRDGRLRELWVDVEGDRLVEREGEPSTPALAGYFAALGLLPREGHVAEVCLALEPWTAQVCERLTAGAFLTLDYGATAEELFGRPEAGGTLRAYQDQAVAVDPLAAPGALDLTADVDFTTLIRTAERCGLRLAAFTTQRDFLLAVGWRDWLRTTDPGGRRALADLIDPELMGRTRVLEMVRTDER